jgi:hypothetical protein
MTAGSQPPGAAAPPVMTPSGEWTQSLADGAPGIALAHIARAHTGLADWAPVHRLARHMTSQPIHAHPRISSLYHGAPAVAYALRTAGHPAYQRALNALDDSITDLIRARLAAARQRMNDGRIAAASEYDLINGLTGLGAYLLHSLRSGDHHHAQLRDVLSYLVRLTTTPIVTGNETLPGWWAKGSPDRRHSPRWQDGHAGFGMAHGISGPLALLAIAMRHGVTVPGHADAITTICAWLDQWKTTNHRQTWWPEVISRHHHRTGGVDHHEPHRPSWCYGTPGVARAQQLAGIATNDDHRAAVAEHALTSTITDTQQLGHLTEAGLCHGWAGLVQTVRRAGVDARTEALRSAATTATSRMLARRSAQTDDSNEGFLTGSTGVFMTDLTLESALLWWDACLLLG